MGMTSIISLTNLASSVARTGDTNGTAANRIAQLLQTGIFRAAKRLLTTELCKDESQIQSITSHVICEFVRNLATKKISSSDNLKRVISEATRNSVNNAIRSANRKKRKLFVHEPNYRTIAEGIPETKSDLVTAEELVEEGIFEKYRTVVAENHLRNSLIAKTAALEVDGFSYAEIAEKLDTHHSSVIRAAKTAHAFFRDWWKRQVANGEN